MDNENTEVIIVNERRLDIKAFKMVYKNDVDKTQEIIKKISEINFKKATSRTVINAVAEELKTTRVKTYESEYSNAALEWVRSAGSKKNAIIIDIVKKEFHVSDRMFSDLNDDTKKNVMRIKDLIDPDKESKGQKEREDKESEKAKNSTD